MHVFFSNYSDALILLKRVNFKVPSIICRHFCLSLNVLMYSDPLLGDYLRYFRLVGNSLWIRLYSPGMPNSNMYTRQSRLVYIMKAIKASYCETFASPIYNCSSCHLAMNDRMNAFRLVTMVTCDSDVSRKAAHYSQNQIRRWTEASRQADRNSSWTYCTNWLGLRCALVYESPSGNWYKTVIHVMFRNKINLGYANTI